MIFYSLSFISIHKNYVYYISSLSNIMFTFVFQSLITNEFRIFKRQTLTSKVPFIAKMPSSQFEKAELWSRSIFFLHFLVSSKVTYMDGGSTLVKGGLNVNAVRMKSILTSLTGAYTISALEQHQFNVIRAAFRFTFSSPMVSNDRNVSV